jgi:hypothetical protein
MLCVNENKREPNERRICDTIEERMITLGLRIGRSSHVKIEFEKGHVVVYIWVSGNELNDKILL